MSSANTPVGLRVEHGPEPLGVGTATPRLSWILPAGVARQVAYTVEIDGGDGPRTFTQESDEHVLVPWPGEPLDSRRPVRWRVRIVTAAGPTAWSDWHEFETGVLDNAEWRASWIGAGEGDSFPKVDRPVWHLCTTFDLPAPARSARLYATAHGVYEAFLNEERVGDRELTPGTTSYDKTLDVQAYDVTGLLRPGANTLSALLSDGWYRGRNGVFQDTDIWGDRTSFFAELHVTCENGASVVITTDDGWQAAPSRITRADLMTGQACDLRTPPHPDAAEHRPVRIADAATETLAWSAAPAVRRVEEIGAVSVTEIAPGRHIVDLGQNISGWVRLTGLGPAGTALKLSHGEHLDADGDVTTEHLGGEAPGMPTVIFHQTDEVVSAGRPGEAFEPRHTVHGFRYVRIEGHPGPLTAADVTGVVVHSDLRRTGRFRCSDDDLNRFYEAAVWSFRGNAVDVPTDCPTRERAGWTGDFQLYAPTASFLYDIAGFGARWLRAVADEQLPDGCVVNISPSAPADKGADPKLAAVTGSAGWGDAAVLVPWTLYTVYNDEQVLRDQWPSMTAWVDFQTRNASEKRHQSRVDRSAEAAAHEQYLWDGTFHWGEWTEPKKRLDDGTWVDPVMSDPMAWFAADKGEIGTAYFFLSASTITKVADVLGKKEEAAAYRDLAARILDAWRTEYVSDDGKVASHSQAGHVRALAFGLVPEHLRAAAAQHLAQLIEDAGVHLTTGFLATPLLLPVLADTGHTDLAYRLLLQRTYPSWLAMTDRGATTVWENWEGVDEDGVASGSLNHYSKGAVIHFLHTHTAGIRLLEDSPGYRRFVVRPVPGGDLTWAEASLDSTCGPITSRWERDGDRFTLKVTVPPGSTARVIMPDGQEHDARPGAASWSCELPRP
ncbi:family 78 glycoside hydrolase catalytic domain [Streptomyces collinus]|uniref:family 78 glycoside hydrolase catalytic domain n=1 Tax=Streptomyces collinus TaxID=42684 RepID=UPI0036A8FF0D